MAVSTADRCKRCGTMLRNHRSTCPSCGLDLLSGPLPTPEAGPDVSGSLPVVPGAARKRPQKSICPLCMASVPDDQFVELEGEKICTSCAENMKNKAAKKGAAPPPQQGQ